MRLQNSVCMCGCWGVCVGGGGVVVVHVCELMCRCVEMCDCGHLGVC